MFLEHFGLNEEPFGVTPDPRFLYLGPKHREALASLIYSTESRRGFVGLVGKPGMGKTSLLFQYLDWYRDKARTAFVFQTDCNSLELLRHILTDLGLDATGKDLPSMHEMFNKVLLQEMQAGRRFILVIDEAQNLEEKALESIRLLSNFETPWMKLMQIVLAGQPQLAERLAQPSLTQLRQRISVVAKIEPFTLEQVATYMNHRLWVAGYEGPTLFTDRALFMIAEHSEGIPRNINNICFNALSLACALKKDTIDREIIDEVLADLELRPNGETAFTPQAKTRQQSRTTELTYPSKAKSVFRSWALRIAVAAMLSLFLIWPVKQLLNGSKRQALDDSLQAMFAAPTSGHASPKVPADQKRIPAQTKEATPEQQTMVSVNDSEPSSDTANQPPGETHSVEILPGQTLYRVAIENFGRYNDEIFRELRELNPWLTDPSSVTAGQVIILPSTRNPASRKLSAGSQAVDSHSAVLEKQ